MARKQPWLNYKGALAEVRENERLRKMNIKRFRHYSTALLLLIILGHFGVHRYYVYDSKGGRKILIKFLLIYFVLIIPLAILLSDYDAYISAGILTGWFTFWVVSHAKLKTDIELVNEEILNND